AITQLPHQTIGEASAILAANKQQTKRRLVFLMNPSGLRRRWRARRGGWFELPAKKKGAPRGAPFCALWNRDYSSPPFFLGAFFFRAAPRISPSEAPLSEEPYCSTASFSSATSRALMERETLRLALSTL